MDQKSLSLIDYPSLDPSRLADEFELADARLRQSFQSLADAEKPTFSGHIQPILDAERNCQGYSLLHHLAGVVDGPDVRAAIDRCQPLAVATSAWVMDNEKIYHAYGQVAQESGLDEWQQALLRRARLPYERRGFGLPEATKQRLGEISGRLSELATRFSRNLLDTQKSWHLVLTQEQVAGIPESRQADLVAAGKRWNSPTGYAVDLLAPAVGAVLLYCNDRQVREAVWRADNQKGAPEGPGGKEASNLPLVLEILSLREEKANLCGQPSYAHWALQDRMAGTPEQAVGLLEQLRDRSRPAALAEFDKLSGFARAELGLEEVLPWDVDFVAEKQISQRLGFPSSEIAQYFPLDHVVDGLLDVSARLFGVQFELDPSIPAWNDQVRFYRVIEDGKVLGGFYLDMFSRAGKRAGAWMRTLQPRSDEEAPVGVLVLNAAQPEPGKPAIMRHGEVVTLFHEFGHGLHLLLGMSPYADVDMSGVERDAIECPSQLMENFAWDPEVLRQLSSHVDTGQKMPETMIQSLIDSRNHNVGMFLVRQLNFGLADLSLHSNPAPGSAQELARVVDTIRDQTHVVPLPEGTRDNTITSFSHIFAGGYAAGYYGYLWAEVLSSDAFDAFSQAQDGPISATAGAQFRQEILAAGAVREFARSFEAFRGRGPTVDALLACRGLSPAAPRPVAPRGF